MGRGGARGKASSAGQAYDTEAVFIPISLNVSVFEFLLSGHFEQDYLSYCANRLNDYSCLYWFDPTVSSDLKVDAFGLNAETGHAIWDSRGHKQPYLTVKAVEHLQGSFSFFNGVGQRGWSQNTSETLLLVNDLIKLKTPGLWAVILPLLYIVAILLFLPTLHSIRKLSRTKLPIASFVVYILVLEFIGLILQLADCILVVFKGIRVLTITQFVGRSACQSLAMAYSCFRHVLSLLYLALALDTLRYAKSPRCRYTSFNRHCAYNILILAIALMATMNSQFFWTFDLSSVQNHIASGDNVDVFYQCDFLASWPLNPAFLSYFWPLADHLIGEILPCVVPILAGIICLSRLCLSRPKRTSFLPLRLERNGTPGGSPFLKRRLTEQAIWIIPIFYMLNASSILPRLLFFGMKYFLFAGDHPSKVGVIFYEETGVGEPANFRTVVVKKTYRQTRGSDLIVYMQVVEHILRFIPPLFALLKAGLLIGGLNEARRLTVDAFSGIWRTNRLCFRRSWLNKMAATETLRDTAPPNADQQLRRRRRRRGRPDSQESVEKFDTGEFELKSVGAREMNSVVPRGLSHVPTPVCVNQTQPGSRRIQNQYVEEFSV